MVALELVPGCAEDVLHLVCIVYIINMVNCVRGRGGMRFVGLQANTGALQLPPLQAVRLMVRCIPCAAVESDHQHLLLQQGNLPA